MCATHLQVPVLVLPLRPLILWQNLVVHAEHMRARQSTLTLVVLVRLGQCQATHRLLDFGKDLQMLCCQARGESVVFHLREIVLVLKAVAIVRPRLPHDIAPPLLERRIVREVHVARGGRYHSPRHYEIASTKFRNHKCNAKGLFK